MREIGIAWILIAGLWSHSQVWAAETTTKEVTVQPAPAAPVEAPELTSEYNCKSIPEDLKAMREAQDYMLESMVRKNTSLAETLDLFAKDFSSKKGRLKKLDFQKLKGSAEAFRGHAQREQGLVDRFESTTADLVARIQKCLESGPVASQ